MRRFCLCAAVWLVAASADAQLKRQWKLDETSGTVAADSSGNGDGGTYQGSPSLNQAGPGGDWTVAAEFNGSSQYINDLNSQATLWGSTSGSIAGRFRCDSPASTANEQVLVELGGGTTGAVVYIYGNQLYAGQSIGGVFYYVSGAMNDTNWHSFVLAINGTALELFVDGSSVDTDTRAAGNMDGTGDSLLLAMLGNRTHLGLYLAGSGVVNYFDGAACDIRVYSDAKDVAFASSYNAEQTGGGGGSVVPILHQLLSHYRARQRIFTAQFEDWQCYAIAP